MEARPGMQGLRGGLRGGGRSAPGAAGVARAGGERLRGRAGSGPGCCPPPRCPGTRASPQGGLTSRGLCLSDSLLQIKALRHPGTPTRFPAGPASLSYILSFFHNRLYFLSANGKLFKCTDWAVGVSGELKWRNVSPPSLLPPPVRAPCLAGLKPGAPQHAWGTKATNPLRGANVF